MNLLISFIKFVNLSKEVENKHLIFLFAIEIKE